MVLLLLPMLTLGFGTISVLGLSALDDRGAVIRDVWLPSVGVLGHLQSTVERFRTAQLQYAATDSASRGQAEGELLQRLQDVDQARVTYQSYIAVGTEDESLMHDYDQAWADYKQFNRKFVDGQIKLTDLLGKQVLTSLERVRASLQKDLSFNLAMGLKAADESSVIYWNMKWIVIGLTFLTTAICLWLCYKISPHTYVRSKTFPGV
jgi:hypothetical protein